MRLVPQYVVRGKLESSNAKAELEMKPATNRIRIELAPFLKGADGTLEAGATIDGGNF
jgi:hypothetical protein